MAMNGIDRRDFLKGTGWMGLAAVAAGCQTGKAVAVVDDKPAAPAAETPVAPPANESIGAPMAGFVAPKLERVRIGFVGVGKRGQHPPHAPCGAQDRNFHINSPSLPIVFLS